jgi:hypothetical protein
VIPDNALNLEFANFETPCITKNSPKNHLYSVLQQQLLLLRNIFYIIFADNKMVRESRMYENYFGPCTAAHIYTNGKNNKRNNL